MQIGFNAPTAGPLAAPAALVRLAVEGEAMGFDYLTFSDHVVIPTDIQARYPYSETGEFPQGARGGRHEQLTAVSFIAAKTSRIRLVTSVMVVPHRPAVLTAKMLATIDVLSGGRLTVGIGAGWLREEFEAIGAPPFAERGAVTDEYVQAFRALWTEEDPHFAGRHVRFGGIVFAPKPVQRPHPPIIVGGAWPYGARRAVRYGQGWIPRAGRPEYDDVTNFLPQFHAMVRAAGRDPADLPITVFRIPPERLQHYADLGVSRVVITLPAAQRDKIEPILDRWAPLLRQFG